MISFFPVNFCQVAVGTGRRPKDRETIAVAMEDITAFVQEVNQFLLPRTDPAASEFVAYGLPRPGVPPPSSPNSQPFQPITLDAFTGLLRASFFRIFDKQLNYDSSGQLSYTMPLISLEDVWQKYFNAFLPFDKQHLRTKALLQVATVCYGAKVKGKKLVVTSCLPFKLAPDLHFTTEAGFQSRLWAIQKMYTYALKAQEAGKAKEAVQEQRSSSGNLYTTTTSRHNSHEREQQVRITSTKTKAAVISST